MPGDFDSDDAENDASADYHPLIPAHARLARRRFARLFVADESPDLTEVALAIAQEERADLDLAGCRQHLEELVAGYQQLREVEAPTTAADEARVLCRFLADQQGYRGNDEEYYDPDNSYLDQVLERRMGIPISLGLLYLHLGRALGLSVEGIGFPGHFLVALTVDDNQALIDPFAGRPVTDAGLQQLLDKLQGPDALLRDQYLQPISVRELVMRMLGNLKAIYQQQADYSRLLACCDRILLIDPHNSQELLQRVGVYQQLNQTDLALAELARLRASAANQEFRAHLEQMMLALGGETGPLQ